MAELVLERVNPNKALWEKGDFTRIADTMRESGEDLVATLGIEPGIKVLDLGCGDGTTALPAAELGATVTGVDIAANLVAAGNERAASAGLANIRFQEGDASDLRCFHAGTFDLVVSIFGAMFAPRPLDVAKEMVRVAKPGGRIVMPIGEPHEVQSLIKVTKQEDGSLKREDLGGVRFVPLIGKEGFRDSGSEALVRSLADK